MRNSNFNLIKSLGYVVVAVSMSAYYILDERKAKVFVEARKEYIEKLEC